MNLYFTESELATIFDALDVAMENELDQQTLQKLSDLSDRIYETLDNLHSA